MSITKPSLSLPNFKRVRKALCLIICVGFLGCLPAPIIADDDSPFDRDSLKFHDTLRLRSGETLAGRVIEEKKVNKRSIVVFETLDGVQLSIDVAKMVDARGVRPITDDAARYNALIDKLPDTASAHHDMVTWCEEQDRGEVLFKRQIEFHQRRIMALDPNDDKIRRSLGYEYIEEQGRWVHKEQYYKSIGYVGSKLTPTLTVALEKRDELAEENPHPSIGAYRIWERRLSTMSAAQAEAALLQIVDEPILAILIDDLKSAVNPRTRAVYVEAFGKKPSRIGTRGLVQLYIDYGDQRALDLLLQEGADLKYAASLMLPFLKNSNNAIVERAGYALGQFKVPYTILPLADALKTTHTVKPAGDAGRMTTTFGNNGVSGFGVGENSKPVKMEFSNKNVLAALEEITEEKNFGFNSSLWYQWYLDNYTHRYLPPRR